MKSVSCWRSYVRYRIKFSMDKQTFFMEKGNILHSSILKVENGLLLVFRYCSLKWKESQTGWQKICVLILAFSLISLGKYLDTELPRAKAFSPIIWGVEREVSISVENLQFYLLHHHCSSDNYVKILSFITFLLIPSAFLFEKLKFGCVCK